MITISVRTITQHQKEVRFVNDKCGHEQKFNYSVPYMCQDSGCTEKLPKVERLYGPHNQDNRVKYFVKGVI